MCDDNRLNLKLNFLVASNHFKSVALGCRRDFYYLILAIQNNGLEITSWIYGVCSLIVTSLFLSCYKCVVYSDIQ